jgi:hypothetical protein
MAAIANPPPPLGQRITLRIVPPRPQPKILTLRPWQTEWAQRAYNILIKNHGYGDTSRMGSGKTFVALWLAQQFGFGLIIVCPVTMIDVWRRTSAEYGVRVIDIISYQSLRSTSGHQPKHGFLTRLDTRSEKGRTTVHFTPTQKLLTAISTGCMMVFDEIQNIKNNSDQHKACSAMITPILTDGGTSRFALLSGTPFDKEEHSINLMKLIGYISAREMYTTDPITKAFVPRGIQELVDSCAFMNQEETQRVLDEIPMVPKEMSHLTYTLFVRVVKPFMFGAMPTPESITTAFDVQNGFYAIDPASTDALLGAIKKLSSAVKYDADRGTVDMTEGDTIGAVTKALLLIENAKVRDMVRVARKVLTENNKSKVILAVNYISTMEDLRLALAIYNPGMFNGQVKPEKRAELVREFNNDPNRRVLIMNISVGGVGISLHDTVGDAPRTMLMSPGYKMLEIIQAAGRIFRDGTMSDATVRMFYGKGEGMTETAILNAMAKKTPVLRGTLETDVTSDLKFPGEYPTWIEGQQ